MKSISFLFFFTMLFQSIAFGQTSDSQKETTRIGVGAEVATTIELITVQSMTFGSLQPGQEEIYVNPINSLNAGFMIGIGTPSAEFKLTYLPERVLTQVGGRATLTFTYEISGNSEENQSTSELLDNNNRNFQFNASGRYFFWIGGRLDISNAAPGNYEGDFTIEIDYI
jgi:hypothetical protein